MMVLLVLQVHKVVQVQLEKELLDQLEVKVVLVLLEIKVVQDQLEKALAGPDVSGIVSNEKRDVAKDLYTFAVGVAF